MRFRDVAKIINKRLNKLMKENDYLFRVNISGDELWKEYLESFPDETNKMFRERTYYDCSTCKHFIRNVGNVVAIKNNKIVTIWDDYKSVDYPFNIVFKNLFNLIKSANIENVFLTKFSKFGCKSNKEYSDNEIITWHHFWVDIEPKFVTGRVGSKLSNFKGNRDVFKRSLEEIPEIVIEEVLDLIKNNNLYRGEQYESQLKMFLKSIREYNNISDEKEKDNFIWLNSVKQGTFCKIRNTAIGQLLLDIAQGTDIDKAVRAYEKMVAPENYKRPKPIVTKNMIRNAKKKIEELGYMKSLERRHANIDDIDVNNIIFTDKSKSRIKNIDDVFDELEKSIPTKTSSNGKKIKIGDFVDKIIPQASKIEILFENRLESNLVSLITATHEDAPIIFKWNNPFSWTYNGEVADSIKQKVAKAGGKVKGVLRASLNWFNIDDLDLHIIEPKGGSHIYYGTKKSHKTKGELDVDMNVEESTAKNDAVENIVYPDKHNLIEGIYQVYVHNYTKRKSTDVGFIVEVEFDGQIYTFTYDAELAHGQKVKVVDLKYDKKKGFSIYKKYIKMESKIKDIWNITTGNFHPVNFVMLSPNYWNDNVGHKHYMFFIENCKNPEPCRGFYNEFLKDELREHRKVFELLGSRMKVPYSDNQLSGLGFSSSTRNNAIFKVIDKNNNKMLFNVKF